jgi:hypothetical protein
MLHKLRAVNAALILWSIPNLLKKIVSLQQQIVN